LNPFEISVHALGQLVTLFSLLVAVIISATLFFRWYAGGGDAPKPPKEWVKVALLLSAVIILLITGYLFFVPKGWDLLLAASVIGIVTGCLFDYGIPMNVNESLSPRFQHVTVTFPPGQEARLRSFYVGVLGFLEKPTPKVVKPLGWIWFNTGVPGVELHCVPDEEPVSANTRHHFCLEIDDLDRQRQALTDYGIKVVEARALPMRPRFFARDPFNNLIEFVRVEGDYLAAGD
jgi:catechol 2,3-dioxygenase-like lactoylglutathione lyase family enzyme